MRFQLYCVGLYIDKSIEICCLNNTDDVSKRIKLFKSVGLTSQTLGPRCDLLVLKSNFWSTWQIEIEKQLCLKYITHICMLHNFCVFYLWNYILIDRNRYIIFLSILDIQIFGVLINDNIFPKQSNYGRIPHSILANNWFSLRDVHRLNNILIMTCVYINKNISLHIYLANLLYLWT